MQCFIFFYNPFLQREKDRIKAVIYIILTSLTQSRCVDFKRKLCEPSCKIPGHANVQSILIPNTRDSITRFDLEKVSRAISIHLIQTPERLLDKMMRVVGKCETCRSKPRWYTRRGYAQHARLFQPERV